MNTSVVNLFTDVNGGFSTSAITDGMAEITAGKWGYETICINSPAPATTPVILQLQNGIYDDFTFDFGWTVTGTAVNGAWERGEPIGTYIPGFTVNPDTDATDDCSEECYVTGNDGGGFNGDDVDDGFTQLASPVFDLSAYADPYLSYERWYKELSGTPNNADTLFIRLSNGSTSSLIENVLYTTPGAGIWTGSSFKISDYMISTSNMQLIVYIEDKQGSNNPLECGFDKFRISEGPLGINEITETSNSFSVSPNPFSNQITIRPPKDGFALANNSEFAVKSIQVYDLTGRKVKNFDINNTKNKEITLDLSAIQNGIYLMSVTHENGKSELLKIVKLK